VASGDERPDAVYAGLAAAFEAEARDWTARFNLFANLRLAAFVACAACLIVAAVQSAPPIAAIGLAMGGVFIMLVRQHRLVGRRRDRALAMQTVNQTALARLQRDWSALPRRHAPYVEPMHPYSADLDIFGTASLMQLVDTTTTSMGSATLARWLLAPAPVDEVDERQRAVRELTRLLDLRQWLEAEGIRATTLDPEPFVAWAEGPSWLRRRPWVRWAARLSPALLVVLMAGQIVGLVPGPWWLPFLFINGWLWHVAGKRAYATLERMESLVPALKQYAACFDVLASTDLDAPRLQKLLRALNAHEHERSANVQMRLLERIAQFVIPRSAQVYWVVQPLVLWDLHVLAALEVWQARNAAHVRAWLDALGEIEALAVLASLAHAHPDWALPTIDPTAQQLVARQAGHPLLSPDTRVDNDVQLGPSGTFLLVTGSNMAGKSTYLRTIGINVVLAQAGGPVCARAWRMPPLALWTSMRIVDSLERGVSTFLAEVLRLKQIVEATRGSDGDARRVCFLLDEILQGTNTTERQIAARRVMRVLLAHGATGAVSTHDLALVDEPDLRPAAHLVHFTETLSDGTDGPAMTFDYRVRDGLATSTNALRLVAMLGLDDAAGSADQQAHDLRGGT